MDTQIVVFEGFDELDAIGPYEVLQNAARFGADFDVGLVTLERRDVVRASHGLRVEPDGTLGDPALLVVPGGGWNDRSSAGAWTQVDDGALPERVAELHDAGATVASVCTGGMILAHAGLLDGRPAVTHGGAMDDLRAFDAVDVRDGERVVDDGDVLTAGGVTSGIDLAFHLVERYADSEIAARIATEMEYEPRY